MMRIRYMPAAFFLFVLLFSAYIGLANESPIPVYKQSDKVLHSLVFFLLTIGFYWALETSRRRVVNFTLSFCTGLLGVGSEFVQAILPNERTFDVFDIVANIIGSLSAIGLSTWYHRRMLERKLKKKAYHAIPTSDRDIELADNVGQSSSSSSSTDLERELSTNQQEESSADNDRAASHHPSLSKPLPEDKVRSPSKKPSIDLDLMADSASNPS